MATPLEEGQVSERETGPKGRRSLGRLARRAVAHLGDSLRVLELLLLRPAALYLPRRWALAVADAEGFLLYLTPVGARARRVMRATFPGADASKLALEQLRRPFRDYVILKRVTAHRDDPRAWSFEWRNTPAALKNLDASVIVATGHFSREATSSLYLPGVVPKKLACVIAPVDRRSIRPRAVRIRMQMDEVVEAMRLVHGDDVDIIEVGDRRSAVRLAKHLNAPNRAIVIAADAPWPKGAPGAYTRPFAGQAAHTVALGTARLARLSQCPILVCVPFLNEAGRVVLEWSDPIPPPAKHDDQADERITDMMLDILERGVGLRPEQYVRPIGDERHWNAATQAWEDQTTTSASAQVKSEALMTDAIVRT